MELINQILAIAMGSLIGLMIISTFNWIDAHQFGLFNEKWRADLTISTQYISKNEVYYLLHGNQIIAYYSYFSLDKEPISANYGKRHLKIAC